MSNILQVRDLVVEFKAAEGLIRAVDGVSFAVPKGKTVALVGESGSGKSVVSQTIMQILPNTANIVGGNVLFMDPEKPASSVDLIKLPANSKEMRAIRGGRVSIIFQEPMTSLSPLHTIGDQISEALFLHRDVSKKQGLTITVEMLRMVGFPSPEQAVFKYPFELSGGLRQRAMIAMALVCRPALLIADEPTTALDVTIQAQILKLIADLQSELNMAVLMITHDLGVVANVADEVVVMYHGKVMERGPVTSIFKNPEHPYLKALMLAVPRFGMKSGERLVPLRAVSADAGNLLKQKKPWPKSAREAGPLLQVNHLCKSFGTRKNRLFGGKKEERIMAVDDVSFDVNPGECVGLVGESGCGKTTTSKMIMVKLLMFFL